MARFCVACFLPLCALPTYAQPADPRTPSRITIPEVTSPGIDANALKPVEEDGLPATVTKRHLRLAALIARLRAKEVSPQSAWQTGDLSLDDLLYVLNTPALLDGSLENEPVRLGLAGLLTEHLPAALKNVELKRWAAYYFASVADARAVPLLEELLDTIKQPAPSEAAAERSMYLLMRLSAYYDKVGDPAKAAETLLRAEGYAQGFKMPTGAGGRAVPIAGMVANRLRGAAQLYQRAGQPDKAREIYARIAKYGYGWASGIALIDQARSLIERGQHDQARTLLRQPVNGRYADQIEPVKQMLLGYSYYLTGNLQEAHKHSQQAVAQYRALPNPLKGEGLEAIIAAAEERLQLTDRWIKEPIQVEPREIVITIPKGSMAPVVRRVQIRTFRDMPLQASSDAAAIKAHITTGDGWDSGTTRGGEAKEIVVEVTPNATLKADGHTLIISSPGVGFQARVPVRIEVR